jgi:LPXTG-motif cell wall-anchored protein
MAYLNTQHPVVRNYNPQGCIGCAGVGDVTSFVTSPAGLLLGAAAAWFFLFRKKRG